MTPGHRRQPDALLTSVDESGRAAALADAHPGQLYTTAACIRIARRSSS
jgi:hypothetical protein